MDTTPDTPARGPNGPMIAWVQEVAMSRKRSLDAVVGTFLLLCLAESACVNTTAEGNHRRKPGRGGDDSGNNGGGGSGKSPTVASVSISPSVPFVDGPVECSASYSDPDSDHVTASYVWRNVNRDTALGSGAHLTLSPDDIDPGDTLRCEVDVEDADGNSATGHTTVTPGCGFYDEDSLKDVSLSIHFIFRPYKTDDLVPGYEGEPWDWDGDVPDWISDVVDVLDALANVAEWVYPDPSVMTAAEALDFAQQVLDAMEEYGPGLFAATVPPDPNLYPYLFDSDGNLYSYSDVGVGFSYDDSYEADLTLPHQNLVEYAGVAVDLEDYDLAFDDNMGDYLDQGSIPLALSSQLALDGAYCTTTYYNPTSRSSQTDVALVPSSILWMQIEVR